MVIKLLQPYFEFVNKKSKQLQSTLHQRIDFSFEFLIPGKDIILGLIFFKVSILPTNLFTYLSRLMKPFIYFFTTNISQTMKIFAPHLSFHAFFLENNNNNNNKKKKSNQNKKKTNKQKQKKRQQRRFRCTGKLNQRFPMYFEIKFYFPK